MSHCSQVNQSQIRIKLYPPSENPLGKGNAMVQTAPTLPTGTHIIIISGW